MCVYWNFKFLLGVVVAHACRFITKSASGHSCILKKSFNYCRWLCKRLLVVSTLSPDGCDFLQGMRGAKTRLTAWIELSGVDERVGADVEKSGEYCDVVSAVKKCVVRVDVQKQIVDVVGCPRDGVECADKDHCLDDVGLDLM